MPTFRQNTLTQLASDLAKIKASNSYSNNLHERIVKGYIALSDTEQFPHVFYLLGGETVQETNESDTLVQWECDVVVGVHFNSNADYNKSGSITNQYETLISDIKNFLHGGLEQKFEWQSIQNQQGDATAVRLLIEQVEPYIDYKNNKGTVMIVAKLTYWENI